MGNIDYDRMEELRSKEYLTPKEFRELGHMRLQELIRYEVAC